MKKKGFTLIELIVVIAIIGVLAAIITPAMMGYVKKSKINSANSSSTEIIKTINAILADDTQSAAFAALEDGDYSFNMGVSVGTALETVSDDENVPLTDYISDYNDTLSNETFAVYIKEGLVVAAALNNGKYYGTSPSVLTNRNYEDMMDGDNSMKQALKLAKEAAGIEED